MEGGVSVAEGAGAEGERVVGADGAEDDVGPVVVESVIDLGDPVGSPAVRGRRRRRRG
jgi:hypothetical protein